MRPCGLLVRLDVARRDAVRTVPHSGISLDRVLAIPVPSTTDGAELTNKSPRRGTRRSTKELETSRTRAPAATWNEHPPAPSPGTRPPRFGASFPAGD